MKNFVFNFITLFIVPVVVVFLFSFNSDAQEYAVELQVLPSQFNTSGYTSLPSGTSYDFGKNTLPCIFQSSGIWNNPTYTYYYSDRSGVYCYRNNDYAYFFSADGGSFGLYSVACFPGTFINFGKQNYNGSTFLGYGGNVVFYNFPVGVNLPPKPNTPEFDSRYSLVNFSGIDLIQGNDQVRGASWDTVLSDGSTLVDITVKLVYRTADDFKFLDVSDLIPQGADFAYVSKVVAQTWFAGLTWDTPTAWDDLKTVTMIVTPMKGPLDYGRSSSIVLWSWESSNRPIRDVPRHMPPGGSYVDPSGQDVSINIDPDYISEFGFDITNNDYLTESETTKKYNYTYIINEGDNVDNSVHNYINNTTPSDNPGDKQSTINFQFNFGDSNTLFDSDQIDSAWSWFTDFFKLIPFLFGLVASLLGFLGGPIVGFLTMGISFALVLIAYKFIRG